MNRERTKHIALFLAIVACAFMLAVAEGLEHRAIVSFIPINGDFQHYNMFRRLLNGQTPFKDFFVMLGLGVMYVNSLVLSIIGDSFVNSVFSTHFLLVLSGTFMVYVLCRLFTKDRKRSGLFSLLMCLFAVSYDTIYAALAERIPFAGRAWSMLGTVTSGVTPLFFPDNASRPFRQMILFVVALILIRLAAREENRENSWLSVILYGALAGGCFLWANDYGPGTYVGMAFVLFLWYFRKWTRKQTSFGRLVAACLLYILASVIAVFVLVSILTKGNFMMWYRSSFSTAGEVFWYNGVVLDGAKLLKLSQMPPLDGKGVYSILFTLLSFLGCVALWVFSKEEHKGLLPHVLVTTALLFVFYFLITKRGYEIEYLNAFHQYAFFGTIGLLLLGIERIFNKENQESFGKVVWVPLAVLALLSVAYSLNVYSWYNEKEAFYRYTYFEELGGNVASFYHDIKEAAAKTKGKTLFSTYASAVEATNDVYQPSRYDYITFTFGDNARKEYVQSFYEADPDYVSIIDRNFTRWEGPMSGVKWFFYRELLDGYSYDFNIIYARYLKKTGQSSQVDLEPHVAIVQGEEGVCDIYVEVEDSSKTYVADVKLNYESNYTERRIPTLTVNKMVTVTGDSSYFFPEENFQCWFIPEKSSEWYAPIMIENGKGHIQLKTYPEDCTTLQVNEVEVLGIYDFEKTFGPSEVNMIEQG